jgi:hypothetical protein
MKDLSISELREKINTAKRKYADCGCRMYKEEAEALAKRIKEITNG